MGRGTESDVCKNVLVVGSYEDFYNRLELLWEMYEDKDIIGQSLLKGWKFKEFAATCGANGRLYGTLLEKGYYEVYLINTDFYEHVGGYDYTVFSDDRDAVLAFKDDFGDVCQSDTIVDVDSVQQTL